MRSTGLRLRTPGDRSPDQGPLNPGSPSPGSLARFVGVALLGAALTLLSANVAPSHADAQVTTVRPDGKGIIGLGLIGAELGLFIPSLVQNAAHTNEWWPYLVFPLIGAGGGGVGGYFLEQATQTNAEIDVAFMVAGMVLIIPAVLGTLAFAAYSPPSESVGADEDMIVEDTDDESVEAVEDETETEAAPTSRRDVLPSDVLAGGAGLLRFDADAGRIMVGVPIVGALATYTAEEVAHLHLQQGYDVHVPMVSATF